MQSRRNNKQLISDLKDYLRRAAPTSARDICQHLEISQPTFSRIIHSISNELVVGGRARTTLYALKREIADVGFDLPIYEIDESGKALHLANLHAIWSKGFHLRGLDEDMQDGWFDDLPFFLDDLRPNGFLGKLIPTRHPELNAPADIRLWTADHCLRYLTRYESDGIGNLIIGVDSFKRHLENIASPPTPIAKNKRATAYPRIADEILAFGPAGSSAGGEQPKFLAVRGPEPMPVLVKFSPPVESDISQRIADLLLSEHIAHSILRESDIESPRSEILRCGNRIFLEMERFDRIGTAGRRGLISLGALDSQFSGTLGNWSKMASALMNQGIINDETCLKIRWLETFGSLIANTDMHRGNISLYTQKAQPIKLAPIYDMLPMMYFPDHGQVPSRTFDTPLPSPENATEWKRAYTAAIEFWHRLASHPDISKGFRSIARDNAEKLEILSSFGAHLP